MKKLYSLIKACMTSDMSLFKIKTKKKNKASVLPIFIGLYLMFIIWTNANVLFEKIEPMHIQFIMLSLIVFGISLMTIIEGVYKSGSLIFNCKDDDLLLSLPIKRSTVIFIRVFKFYVFELVFNSLFLLPVMIAYIRWGEALTWTYYLTSAIMLLFLPIIPIVISCIIGVFTSSLASKFKYKNAAQIIISLIFLLGIMVFSFNIDNILNYFIEHATSMNDLITKIYYPAGIYAKLITEFNYLDLLIFIFVNIGILVLGIYVLSLVYFRINSHVKEVVTEDKKNKKKIKIKSQPVTWALIKKELNTFFKTPVFIINSGFALVLFIIAAVAISIKFDSVLPLLISEEGLNLSLDFINNNMPVLLFMVITITAYMSSISNSVISLEGKNINILKSLPIKIKTILMSKVYSCLVITTPVLLIGDLILFIRFKISFLESILLIVLSILIPLVSHFIGLIVNLKYPKLDAENSTEVVKQSASSFISVITGMVLLVVSIVITMKVIQYMSAIEFLGITTLVYIVINLGLYMYLVNIGTKEFRELTV